MKSISKHKIDVSRELVTLLRGKGLKATVVGSCSYMEHMPNCVDTEINDIDIILHDSDLYSPQAINGAFSRIPKLEANCELVDEHYIHFGIHVSRAHYKNIPVHFIFEPNRNSLESFEVCPKDETLRFLKKNLLASTKSLSTYLKLISKNYEYELQHSTLKVLCSLTKLSPVELIEKAVANATKKHIFLRGWRDGVDFHHISLEESLKEILTIS